MIQETNKKKPLDFSTMAFWVSIHWWNFGSKKLDYEGEITGYLEKRGISYSEIVHPIQADIKGFRFVISVSSCTITFDSYEKFNNAATDAIKLFLTIMGDKATMETRIREYKLNWG